MVNEETSLIVLLYSFYLCNYVAIILQRHSKNNGSQTQLFLFLMYNCPPVCRHKLSQERKMEKENVELIHWSDRLSCGIKLIDDQSRSLVALVNDMFNHVTGDEIQEYEYYNKIIQEAIKYIKIQFVTEEKLMLAAKIPGYAIHKKAHARFILTVIDIVNQYNAGKKINLFLFTKFLKDWILSHVALMDKQYFKRVTVTSDVTLL